LQTAAASAIFPLQISQLDNPLKSWLTRRGQSVNISKLLLERNTMFTGLIQASGKLVASQTMGGGVKLCIDITGLQEKPVIGASIAVNGVCLTVTELNGNVAGFDAVSETVTKSNLKKLFPGKAVNLEPALKAGDPLDGHIVQGHVDCVGTLLEVRELPESKIVRFSLPDEISHLVALKGSVAVDGVSLTVCDISRGDFCVSVIPHTWKNTTFCFLSIGDKVNLEADVIARYIARATEIKGGGLTEALLRENGF
jgi:riboflavin synthase